MIHLRLFFFFLILTGSLSFTLMAQGSTDLYSFQLKRTSDHKYHIYQPSWLSGFNPKGYTNQPWFTDAGDILVSVRKKDSLQNDIYLLSPITKKYRRLTQTRASEYSPRVSPDGAMINVVRQVQGDELDQQVYSFSLKGNDYTSVKPEVRDIGYYAWLSHTSLGLFRIEGESNQLTWLDLARNQVKRITTSIGRSLVGDGKGALFYVHKFTGNYWYIKKYHPDQPGIDIIIETPPGQEDFTRTPDGTFLIGAGSRLLYYHPDHHASWQEMADLSPYGISNITRLAVSPDGRKLALVATHEIP